MPDLEATSGSLILTYSATDNHTAAEDLDFQCRLDGAAYAACASPTTYTTAQLNAMVPGSHTFQVRAVDEADNIGQPASHTFQVADTTAPNTSITGHPQPTTTNTTASFTFSGSDDGTIAANLTFECKLDTGAWAACTSAKTYNDLPAGEHTFSVRATDQAGHTDQSAASYTWTIEALADTTDPDTSITQEPPATTTETSATFAFSSTETGSTFECKLDTGPWAACTSPKTYTGLSVASHTFSVRATDAAGNTDDTPATDTWTVQSSQVNCGPEDTLTATADAWIDSGSPTDNKGSDSLLKVMSKSGGNLRAFVRFNLPTMPQGCSVESATLRIYAKSGAAGRTLQAVQLGETWTEGSVTWATQPVTTGPAITTTSGTGYRDWNVASAVQAMLTSSNHGFLIRDATENQDAEQQFHSREESNNRPQLVLRFGNGAPPPPPPGSQDTTAPETNLTGNPGAATQSTSAQFTFNGVDNATAAGSLTFECQRDVPVTAAWDPCVTGQSYTGLSVGNHTFRVRAKDAAGNVDASPAVHTWVIDQTAPETVITQGPLATTTDTSATFHFQSPETGTTFECAVDQQAFAACTSPKTYTGLSVAPHTFKVQAIDAAGNRDQSAATYPWTIQAGGAPVNCGTAQTVAANADAWIEQKSPSQNKGTDSVLKVMSKSGSSNLRALVKFALPTAPAGCVLDTATLRLYAGSSASGRTLQALRLNTTWTEGGVTWANQPATSGAAATVASGSGYRQWNVAAIVQAMYSTGGHHGFLIRDASENQDAEQQFFAKEKGEQPPQLVLTFKPASGGAVGGPIVGIGLGEPARLEPAVLTAIVALMLVLPLAVASSSASRRPAPVRI